MPVFTCSYLQLPAFTCSYLYFAAFRCISIVLILEYRCLILNNYTNDRLIQEHPWQAVLVLYSQGLMTGVVVDSGDGVTHVVVASLFLTKTVALLGPGS